MGYLPTGQAYNRFGRGARSLVIFQGLWFENKPLSRGPLSQYTFLGEEFTVLSALRRRGLPPGITLAGMADDYAAMIRAEFGGPVDIIGVSTGGSIALPFAADHPDLVRRLVLHSAAYRLSDHGRQFQREVAELARAGRWHETNRRTMDMMLPRRGVVGALRRPLGNVAAAVMTALDRPEDAHDFLVTVAAEDAFDFKARLSEIAAPTLVIAGTDDPYYSPALFRETAAGIPHARLILYEGRGHGPGGKQFGRDVLAFLRGEG